MWSDIFIADLKRITLFKREKEIYGCKDKYNDNNLFLKKQYNYLYLSFELSALKECNSLEMYEILSN